MTALYLLEPERPGAAWAPVRRRAADRRAAGRAPGASASAGRRPASVEASGHPGRARRRVSRGRRAAGARRPGRSTGRRSSAASWFAPDRRSPGSSAARPRAAGARGATVGWIVPPGERWTGRTSGATRVEVDGLPLRGSFDLVTALERFLGEDCADFRAAPVDRRARGQPRPGRSGRRHRPGRGGRAGRGLRRAPRRGRARAGRRGAARHPARGPALRRPGHQRARRLPPGLGVRPRVPGPRRDLGQRVPRLRQQEPRRVRGPQRGRPLGQPRRAHHDVQPQEHLRPGAARGRRPAGSRPAARIWAPCSATTPRPRSARCSPPAPWSSAGANVFGPPTPPKYVPPFAWGGAGDERLTRRRLPPGRRAGDAAPRGGAHAGAAPVARADVRARHHADDAALRARARARGATAARSRRTARRSCSMPGSARARSSAARPTVGLDLARVAGIALTHEHGDHACGAPRLARRLGVPVLTAAGTWDRLAPRHGRRRAPADRPPRARSSSGRSGSRPAPPATTPPTRWRSWCATADGTGVGVAYDLGPAHRGRPLSAARTSRRSCWRPTTTRCSSGPAATRRWCSAGSRDRAATCPTGRRPSCWPSCTIPAWRSWCWPT